MNYLSTLFDKGLQYQTLNSVQHCYVDGKPVGKHPRICALLTDVFNQRLPKPRYRFVWDVEIVLVYLKMNMFDNSQLCDKDLTQFNCVKRILH